MRHSQRPSMQLSGMDFTFTSQHTCVCVASQNADGERFRILFSFHLSPTAPVGPSLSLSAALRCASVLVVTPRRVQYFIVTVQPSGARQKQNCFPIFCLGLGVCCFLGNLLRDVRYLPQSSIPSLQPSYRFRSRKTATTFRVSEVRFSYLAALTLSLIWAAASTVLGLHLCTRDQPSVSTGFMLQPSHAGELQELGVWQLCVRLCCGSLSLTSRNSALVN